MSYDVSFKAKLEGTDQWVRVGNTINHTSNTGEMIEKACGLRPSAWDGKKCTEMVEILKDAIYEIQSKPDEYRKYESPNGWGTMNSTVAFLEEVRENCVEFPTAVLDVYW